MFDRLRNKYDGEMARLRLPRTLAHVALSGGLALGVTACGSSGGRVDASSATDGGGADAALVDAAIVDAAPSDSGLADAALDDAACSQLCAPARYYDDGGAIPADALADCSACTSNACPPGCQVVV